MNTFEAFKLDVFGREKTELWKRGNDGRECGVWTHAGGPSDCTPEWAAEEVTPWAPTQIRTYPRCQKQRAKVASLLG